MFAKLIEFVRNLFYPAPATPVEINWTASVQWFTQEKIQLSSGHGWIGIRAAMCVQAGNRPQAIIALDCGDAPEAVAKKFILAVKREMNHSAKFLAELDAPKKECEVALLTNYHSEDEVRMFLARVRNFQF